MKVASFLFVVIVSVSMVMSSNVIQAIPDTPDFDESGIRTTRDTKEFEPGTAADIADNTDCAIKWFYDNNDMPSDSDAYLRVVGNFWGSFDTDQTQNMKIYINGVVKKGENPKIYAHEYFGNTETKNNAQQESRIYLGKKSALGLRTSWNTILMLDMGTLNNKENIKVRTDSQWPQTADYDGSSKALQRSFYSSDKSQSSCISLATQQGKPSSGQANYELMMYMEYERNYTRSVRDDGTWEGYIWFDALDDHLEKRLYVSGLDYSTWGMIDLWAASVGSDNPPWSPGELKLSICPSQHTDSYTCTNHQYVMDFPARTFDYSWGQWGSVIVPESAFQDGQNRDYYFMLSKTTSNYQRESLSILNSTQDCRPNCASRWKWNDGTNHGDWTYNSLACKGEIMMRWRTIQQENPPNSIYKDYTIVAPTRYGPGQNLDLIGPNTIALGFNNNSWRNSGYYTNDNPPKDITAEMVYGQNLGGTGEGAGDTADFLYLRGHGERGKVYLGLDANNQYQIVNSDLLSDGFNYDTEWFIIFGCKALANNTPLYSNGKMLLYYSKIHAIYGFSVDVLASGESTFANNFITYSFTDTKTVQQAWDIAIKDAYGTGFHDNQGWYRQSQQNDKLWGRGNVANDVISGNGDVQEFHG